MAPAPPPAARAALLFQALWPWAAGITVMQSPAACPADCSPEECDRPRYLKDLTRPMVEVLRERPALNGYCYFTQLGAFWFQAVQSIAKSRDLSPLISGNMNFANSPTSPLPRRWTIDGVKITSHTFPSYAGSFYDIPYCHQLGWLQGQRLNGSVAYDFDAWQDVAEAECARLQQLESFRDEDFTFKYHLINRALTTRDFRAHVYGKCLLGTQGVATEMAWCYFGIGCSLDGNYVGHGSECN